MPGAHAPPLPMHTYPAPPTHALRTQAKKGKTKFIIGKGDNMMDFTYVGNVAQAHLQVGGGVAVCA